MKKLSLINSNVHVVSIIQEVNDSVNYHEYFTFHYM